MKKILALLLIATLLPSFTTAPVKAFDIVGKWQGNDAGQTFTMIFDKEGYVTLQKGDEVMGGKEFTLNGEKGAMTYKTDFTKEPDELDLIVTRLTTKQQKILKCIFKVVNDNEMKIFLNFTDVRPTDFNSPQAITFKRI